MIILFGCLILVAGAGALVWIEAIAGTLAPCRARIPATVTNIVTNSHISRRGSGTRTEMQVTVQNGAEIRLARPLPLAELGDEVEIQRWCNSRDELDNRITATLVR